MRTLAPLASFLPVLLAVDVASLPAQQATFATYGTGCNDQKQSFYESFPFHGFDLSGTAAQPGGRSMVATGSGYAVLPLFGVWHNPTGINLGLGDDSVSAALTLGFTFPFPGGSTNSIFVGSNGFVYLAPSTDHGCCAGSVAGLLAGAPRIAAFWIDLIPSAGSVVFDTDGIANAWVTFTNVSEFGGGLNTFQIALSSSGQVDLLYQTCSNANHECVVGWSPGRGARDPGSIDLSLAQPFTTGPDQFPLTLSSAQRPITGTTMTLTTSRIPAGTTLGVLLVSLTRHDPGLDLAGLGMPTCRQYVGLDFANPFAVSGTSANFALPIPSVPSLAGLTLHCQSAAFASGSNALGVLAANGATLRIGTF